MNINEYEQSVFEAFKTYMDEACLMPDFMDPDYNYNEADFNSVFEDAEPYVSGADNGSYHCDRFAAQEALTGIIFDSEFHDLLAPYEYDAVPSFYRAIQSNDPETADVIAREIIYYSMWDEIKKWLENEIGRELN